MSTYIKHNDEWKRTIGVTVNQGDNTVVLRPDSWLDGYEPTITLEYATQRNPSGQYSLRFLEYKSTGTNRTGYANFTWGSDVSRKKARIFYRGWTTEVAGGEISYFYEGNEIILYNGQNYTCGYFDVDDLSKLTSIKLKTSTATLNRTWLELDAIELI